MLQYQNMSLWAAEIIVYVEKRFGEVKKASTNVGKNKRIK